MPRRLADVLTLRGGSGWRPWGTTTEACDLNRTHRLGEAFGDLLFGRRALTDLPERPALCLNTAVLNHASPGRFSRNGFSCAEVGAPAGSQSYPEIPLPERDLGFAVAASAAFPFALPPVTLGRAELPRFFDRLEHHDRLHLTNGGVLENLGVERLLREGRFFTRHVIVSDAGVAENAWVPSFGERLLSFGAYALSAETLSRLLIMMNDKQNKTMRQLVLRDTGALGPRTQERNLWFVRIDQTWDKFLTGIPPSRLRAIAADREVPKLQTSRDVAAFLEAQGVNLAEARKHHDDAVERRSNEVDTNFTALAAADIDALEQHATWQVHACHAIYGPII